MKKWLSLLLCLALALSLAACTTTSGSKDDDERPSSSGNTGSSGSTGGKDSGSTGSNNGSSGGSNGGSGSAVVTPPTVADEAPVNAGDWEYYKDSGYVEIIRYIGDGLAKRVKMPDTIEDLPVSVRLELDGCDTGYIEELVLPSTVRDVSVICTDPDKSVTKLVFPKDFKRIDGNGNEVLFAYNPFSSMFCLKEIVVEEGNPTYWSEDGVLFEHVDDRGVILSGFSYKDLDFLVTYPISREGDYYRQPDNVRALTNCYYNVSKLKVADNVYICLEDSCFTYSSVEEVVLVSNLSYHEIEAMPELRKLTLAGKTTNYTGDLIYDCPKLEEIVVDGDDTFFSVDGVLYMEDDKGYTLMEYPSSRPGEEYRLLDGTVRIRDKAFKGVVNLKKLLVPAASKEPLSWISFYDCGLSDVEIVYEE